MNYKSQIINSDILVNVQYLVFEGGKKQNKTLICSHILLLSNYSQNGWFQATYMKLVDMKLERDGQHNILCENVHTSSQG